MRIFLSLLPKYQNYTSVLASIMHLRSDAGFFVNPQRISETTLDLDYYEFIIILVLIAAPSHPSATRITSSVLLDTNCYRLDTYFRACHSECVFSFYRLFAECELCRFPVFDFYELFVLRASIFRLHSQLYSSI